MRRHRIRFWRTSRFLPEEQKKINNKAKTTVYGADDDEQYVIGFLANAVAGRLLAGDLKDSTRRSLTRILYGLQRFPRITPGLNAILTWGIRAPELGEPIGDVTCSVAIGPEDFTIAKGHRRLQYFVGGSHHLIDFSEILEGERRADFLQDWLIEFEGLADSSVPLHIEDLSRGKIIDQPPISEFWEMGTGWICSV